MTTVRWKVAVNAPIDQPLTYESDDSELQPGDSVVVPLGKRKVDGVILSEDVAKSDSDGFEIKKIFERHSERPRLPKIHLSWLNWLAKYYCHPVGRVLQLCFPPLKKTGRGSKKPPLAGDKPMDTPPQLTEEQNEVYKAIGANEDFGVHLLHGVTGSGKTEVYLHLLKDVLERGQQGLVLVPEISLTPQLIDRFSRRFGPQVAVIHSHLTEREKTDQWWSVVEEKKRILIGARSALFCPIPKLGLIVLDEEHEPSFKQEEKLKYHARDAAIFLGKESNCPVVLGSATPSLETWSNALQKKYHLHEMSRRVENRSMPNVSIVDLREKKQPETTADLPELPFWLSPELFEALRENYLNGKQAALFLNRRGVAQTVTCPACGTTSECPNCAVSLTLHGHKHLVCHYCDYHEIKAEQCTACGEGEPQPIGLGTELVEEDLQRLFPEATMARADRDEISSRQDLEELIEEMENGNIHFLIGTQMIAKGLDFKGLHLVGIVLADVGFNLPDFRAGERIFQLITQVAGRAGRHIAPGEEPGKVFVQTYNPDHPILQFALGNDYRAFADYELGFRKSLRFPPAGRMASLRIQSPELRTSEQAASLVADIGAQLKEKFEKYSSVEILGPVEAPLLKLRNQYRHHVLLKSQEPWTLVQFCHHVLDNKGKLPKKTRLIIDVDPISLL